MPYTIEVNISENNKPRRVKAVCLENGVTAVQDKKEKEIWYLTADNIEDFYHLGTNIYSRLNH